MGKSQCINKNNRHSIIFCWTLATTQAVLCFTFNIQCSLPLFLIMAALSLSSWFKSIDPLPHRCFVSENYEVLSILFVSGSSVFLSIPIMLAEAPTPSFPNSLCVGVFSPHSSSVVHQSCSTRPEQFGQGKSDQRALKAPLSEATNSCPWPALKEMHPAWTSQEL